MRKTPSAALQDGDRSRTHTPSTLGLIVRLAEQPDFTQKPADEGVAARALEWEDVFEGCRELFA